MPDDINLTDISTGSIIAPAGFGKTQLIVEAVKNHPGKKPILILTHTNAGVAALRERLNRKNIDPKKYKLSTIDGWALRLVSLFRGRTSCTPETLKLLTPRMDYSLIREAIKTLLFNGHINDILVANYSRAIVDEYQDCTTKQHEIICFLSQIIPTCVLGDELQAIFGFDQNDPLPSWTNDVSTAFPCRGQLTRPWRWINAGAENLGNWLFEVRGKLVEGSNIDLGTAPSEVNTIYLSGNRQTDFGVILGASNTRVADNQGNVLIIGSSTNPQSRHEIASSVPGAITVETVDLRDLVMFARTLDLSQENRLELVIDFARSVMTKIGELNLQSRISSLVRGTARKEPSELEQIAIRFNSSPSHSLLIELLIALDQQKGVRMFRPAIFWSCIRALRRCTKGNITFEEAAILVREENRLSGRPIPKRGVGSTLLLKGLECHTAVILNAGELSAQNLYVALTRGSNAIVICTRNKILNPST